MEETRDSIRRARPYLGTFVEIGAFAGTGTCGPAPGALDAAVDAAFLAIEKTHRLMSFYDPESDVGRLNREAHGGAVQVDPWTFQVLETAAEMRRLSGGVFDVTLPVSPAQRERDGAGAGVIELLPGCRVRFHDRDAAIDLGGIAKGFAVDCAVESLRSSGVSAALVNAGGDMAVFGDVPQTILIRDPRNPQNLLCEVAARDEALASSGGRFQPLVSTDVGATAIIDPETRRPARAVAGATVRCSSCMLADALTKVVMIKGTGCSDLLEHYAARALVVLESGEVYCSPNW